MGLQTQIVNITQLTAGLQNFMLQEICYILSDQTD